MTRLSIFYSSVRWHHLLSIIKSFKEDYNKSSKLYVQIFFNSDQGQNLRLQIGATSNKNVPVEKILEQIKSYIAANKVVDSYGTVRPTGLFMNFPSNEVYKDLFSPYSPFGYHLHKYDIHPLRNEISNLIIAYFTDEEINTQSVLTFTLNLHSLSLKHFFENTQSARTEVAKYIYKASSWFSTSSIQSIDALVEKIYAQNSREIDQIMESSFTETLHGNDDFHWFEDLASLFVAMKQKHQDNLSIFYQFNDILNQHLNYNNKHFILCSLKIINKSINKNQKLNLYEKT